MVDIATAPPLMPGVTPPVGGGSYGNNELGPIVGLVKTLGDTLIKFGHKIKALEAEVSTLKSNYDNIMNLINTNIKTMEKMILDMNKAMLNMSETMVHMTESMNKMMQSIVQIQNTMNTMMLMMEGLMVIMIIVLLVLLYKLFWA